MNDARPHSPKCTGRTPSKAKATRWLAGTIFAFVSAFSLAWAAEDSLAVAGLSGDPWTHTTVTYWGATRVYAVDMEIEEPPAADFEPSRPEIEQPPPADLEPAEPLTDDDATADFESSQPEIEQSPPADLEPSEPEIEDPDE